MLIAFRQPITRSGGWPFQKEGNCAIISSGKGAEDIIMAKAAAIIFKEFRARYTQKRPAGWNCFASVFQRASCVRNVDAKSFMPFAAGTYISAVPATTRPSSPPES